MADVQWESASRNCKRDEGGPFGFGDQEPIPSHPAAVVKSNGGERCGLNNTVAVGVGSLPELGVAYSAY